MIEKYRSEFYNKFMTRLKESLTKLGGERMKKRFLLILTVAALLFTITACGAADNEVKSTVNGFMQAMKDLDMENAKAQSFMPKMEPIYNEDGELQEIPEDGDLPNTDEAMRLHEKFFKELAWELGDVKVDNDNATVQVKITNKKIPEAFQMALINVYMSGQEEKETLTEEETVEKIMKALDESLEQTDLATQEVEAKLNKKDGKWLLERSEDFMMAIYGNYPQNSQTPETDENEAIEEGGEEQNDESAPDETAGEGEAENKETKDESSEEEMQTEDIE